LAKSPLSITYRNFFSLNPLDPLKSLGAGTNQVQLSSWTVKTQHKGIIAAEA
jgi:hypothetical protein